MQNVCMHRFCSRPEKDAVVMFPRNNLCLHAIYICANEFRMYVYTNSARLLEKLRAVVVFGNTLLGFEWNMGWLRVVGSFKL